MLRFTANITPIGKPRQTQRDKWAKRPVVLRYREFADELRAAAAAAGLDIEAPPPARLDWVARIPMLKSWSNKKRAAHDGQLHRQRPDRDNIDKAILDALFKEDSGIACGYITKVWTSDPVGSLTITAYTEDDLEQLDIEDAG